MDEAVSRSSHVFTVAIASYAIIKYQTKSVV